MKLKKSYKIPGLTLFVVCVLLLNRCFNINLPPGNITNCQLVLVLIAEDLDAWARHTPTEEQLNKTNNFIAYYASHCDGTESKKHKRRKKNDPIYRLSGKDDEY
ncbi:hypothetical protein [Leptospira noguchii]|uniref:hypothetical protein n=1 Tax=Leptospira noguchii TaxID=28182 RepID=UPI00056C94CA|nr:hypothetical protein [Leptospira noguchii]